MVRNSLPLGTWIVVKMARGDLNLVSTHASQHEAEAERDKRNSGLGRVQYRACLAIEPVAGQMGCATPIAVHRGAR